MDRVKLIDETIQVTNINKDGKYFEKGKYHINLNSLQSLALRQKVKL